MAILKGNAQGGGGRRWVIPLLLLFCTTAVPAGEGLPHWLTVLDTDQLKGDVSFLASEELGGRAVVTPGSRTAAAFIASRFQALGLKPAGEGPRDWYQRVPLLRASVQTGTCRVERTGGDGPALELAWKEDFDIRCIPDRFHDFDLSGGVVFAGFGIHAPELGHDDYAGIDTEDRVVIVLDGGPPASGDREKDHRLSSRAFSSVEAKFKDARDQGAKVLIVLPRPGTGREEAHLHHDFWHDDLVPKVDFDVSTGMPVLLLDEPAAARFTAAAGIETTPGGGAPRPLPGLRISCSMKLVYDGSEAMQTRNVLALLPGSDDLHFREFVILSAHYDHLGRRGKGVWYPGADDNASGVAAMLGAARALASLPVNRRPARSILFIAWAGEERGFLGSTQFRQAPTVPVGQIKAMVNLDMVGRNGNDDAGNRNTALASYSAQATDLEWLLDDVAESTGLDLRLGPRVEIGPTSDHWRFHQMGIPAVHLFTGTHRDMHRPGDTPEKLNYEKLLKITRTAALLAHRLADADEIPAFDDTIEKVRTRTDSF